jgi:gluconolactonase
VSGRRLTATLAASLAAVMGLILSIPAAATTAPIPPSAPAASVDLTSAKAVSALHGVWRYREARLVETEFPAPGPDGRPSGQGRRTHDVVPRPGEAGFEMGWEAIDPSSLAARRASGRVSFAWYRFGFTVPDRLGALALEGSTLVMEIVVDDYAEIWVDGVLARDLGQSGGSVVGGFNVPNRVVVAAGARPGQRVDVAVFAINGPLSAAPPNYIWVRSARLDVHPPGPAVPAVVRLDPALDAIVVPGATVEKLAGGFTFTEGPVWLPEGALLFSEPDRNRIHRWTPGGVSTVFRSPSGYEGADIALYRQPGSNGLTLDPSGRLVVCEHGNRRITRLEKDGRTTVLADRFQGRRLNSPNDLVFGSDGSLYFTDPPFGLPRVHDDPGKELPHSGVYQLSPGGELALLVSDLAGPNGIALSPDERFLYVGNWDPARKVVMRYPVLGDGRVGDGTVFLDLTTEGGDQAIDGVKVDTQGRVYVSGPGGIWVVSPEGRRLGLLRAPEPAHNFAWGDADGRSLYITARTGVYRLRMAVSGIRPPGAAGAATGSTVATR